MTIEKIGAQQRRRAYVTVLWQAVVALVIALLCWPLWGWRASYSVAVGGLVCVLPALYFATVFFSVTGALAAPRIARAMYRAEFGKLLLTGLLFVVVFRFLAVDVAPFFGGFVVAQITGLSRGIKV